MLNRKVALMVVGLIALGALCVTQAISQDTGGPGGGGPGGGGRMRGMDPNMFARMFDPNVVRKMASDYMKGALGATDEEWTVLEPKIDKVTKLSMEVRGGMMMGMGMMFGGGGEQSEVMKAAGALRNILAKKDATNDEIKTILQAYRDARAKAKAELEKAQKDLKEVLTLRQEAQLVQMGLLD